MLASNTFLQRTLSNNANVQPSDDIFSYPGHDSSGMQSQPATLDESLAIPPDDAECEEDETENNSDLIPQEINASESISYVVGSVITRINCKDCFGKVGLKVNKAMSSGFIAEMTFDRSKMCVPDDQIVAVVTKCIRPINDFLSANFCCRNIVQLTVERFLSKFEAVPFCSECHKKMFLTFLCRTLIRSLCRRRNVEQKEATSRKGLSKKLKKLGAFVI